MTHHNQTKERPLGFSCALLAIASVKWFGKNSCLPVLAEQDC
jgi:hypothetical protein